jgi:hypothetical protein
MYHQPHSSETTEENQEQDILCRYRHSNHVLNECKSADLLLVVDDDDDVCGDELDDLSSIPSSGWFFLFALKTLRNLSSLTGMK